jgi:hypothetical protein
MRIHQQSTGLCDKLVLIRGLVPPRTMTVRSSDEGLILSDIKLPWHTGSLRLNISVSGLKNGQPLVEYKPAEEQLVAPLGHTERMEWVRKSYERFFEKVVEKEALFGAPPIDLG